MRLFLANLAILDKFWPDLAIFSTAAVHMDYLQLKVIHVFVYMSVSLSVFVWYVVFVSCGPISDRIFD